MLAPASARAIGISPSTIERNDVLPGSAIREQLVFVRSDAEKSANLKVIIEGILAPYIEREFGENVTVPAGVQQFMYPIVIKPGNLGSGTYEATVTVQEIVIADKEKQKTSGIQVGSMIATGAQGKIKIIVSNKQVEKYEIGNVFVPSTEVEQKVGLSFNVRNEGNVDFSPEKIVVKIYDRTDESITFTETISKEKIQIVKGFSSATVSVITGIELPLGLYVVEVKMFDGKGKVIFENKNIALQVFPKGSLAQSGELLALKTDKNQYELGELAEIIATFRNTGEVGIEGALVAEIFKREQRLELIKTDPLYVATGQSGELKAFYRIVDSGEYTVKAHVQFGAHTSKVITTQFSVRSRDVIGIIIILIGSIFIISGCVMWFVKRKKV